MRFHTTKSTTLLKKAGFILLVFSLVLLLCSCSSKTIYGTWKTADGDTLHLSENGTYWRSGSRSEEGRYSEGSKIIAEGDFYRNFDYLKFESNDFTSSPKTYFYRLDGNQLKLCMYINKTDGSFDPDSTYTYKRK